MTDKLSEVDIPDDLVKRLRKRQEFEFIDGHKRVEWADEDALEAADRIEELEKMINQDCICDDSVQVVPSVKQKPLAKRLSGRKIKDV